MVFQLPFALLNLQNSSCSLGPTSKRSRTVAGGRCYRSSQIGLSLDIGPEIAKSVAGEKRGFKVPYIVFLGPGVAFDFHSHSISFLRMALSGNSVPHHPMVCHHFPYAIANLGSIIDPIFRHTQLDPIWWMLKSGRICSTEPMNSLSSRKGLSQLPAIKSLGFLHRFTPNWLVVISVGKVMTNGFWATELLHV